MTKSKTLLASLILCIVLSTQSFCGNQKIKDRYIKINIQQIIGYLISYFVLISNLHNENLFDDANEYDTTLIKKIAKDLGFSEKHIGSLKVKVPKKNSGFVKVFRNNCAAFSNTIILGHQDNKRLSKAFNNSNVKKFVYAHELSHVKYNHSLKTFLSFALSPFVTHYSIKLFNSWYTSFLEKRNLRGLSHFFKGIAINVPKILDFFLTKYIIQLLLWACIRKKFEKTADLSAATLGPDTIRGGIKFLQEVQEMESRHRKAILSQYKGSFFKPFISLYLSMKNFIWKIFGSHPSHEARIKYLQNALKKTGKNL